MNCHGMYSFFLKNIINRDLTPQDRKDISKIDIEYLGTLKAEFIFSIKIFGKDFSNEFIYTVAKILIKNSNSDYSLLPSWTFTTTDAVVFFVSI